MPKSVDVVGRRQVSSGKYHQLFPGDRPTLLFLEKYTKEFHNMSKSGEPVTWKSIWEKKGNVTADNVGLTNLIAIDGFDTGAGEFPVDSWLSFVEDTKIKLRLKKEQKILEVGCGAGAFLLPVYNSGMVVYGIDYSKSHIQLCAKIMKLGTFKVSEANNIPFEDEFFDAVVSNSVFQYFDDLEYAENVVSEIGRVLKKTGCAAILDLNDIDKKEKYESIRRKKLGDKQYDRLYENLKHQFYKKEWFDNVANNRGLKCKIQDQNINGYDNSKFRYNVFLEKE
jgi:ubiquinone/menaquinone biosynthesis C-methylase UbiE